MDNQLKDETRKLGELLMQAFLLSMDTADIYKIGDTIEKWIKEMDLPTQNCSECGTTMSFFNYRLKQGMCDNCAERISKEMDEGEAT